MTWEELQVITLQKMFELQSADLVVDDSTGPVSYTHLTLPTIA